jgi:hypothetical protein
MPVGVSKGGALLLWRSKKVGHQAKIKKNAGAE